MAAREPMSAVDASWYQMDEPGNAADIAGLYEFRAPLDLHRLVQTVQVRLVDRFPRFRQRVVRGPLGGLYWEDDPDFEIGHHIHTVDLGGGGVGDLRHLVGEMTTRRLPVDRSPWQMFVVDDYGPGGALILRIHHCMGDGFALAGALLRLADHSPDAPVILPPGEGTRVEPPHETLWDRLGHEAQLLREHPAHAAEVARYATDLAVTLGEMLLLPFDPPTRLKHELSGIRRVAWSKPLPLATIKQIGRGVGGTVNDTLMAALTGALRAWLQDHGEPVDELDLRAMVPVNLRPVHRIEEMGDDLGNRFGLVMVDLPVSRADPHEQLAALEQGMDALKESPMAVVSFGILNAIGRTPAVIEHVVTHVFARKTSLVCTNVPGPPEPLFVAGQQLTNVVFWVPHPVALGLGVSILSYAGDVRVGVRSDAAVLEDPVAFVERFEEALWRLERVEVAA